MSMRPTFIKHLLSLFDQQDLENPVTDQGTLAPSYHDFQHFKGRGCGKYTRQRKNSAGRKRKGINKFMTPRPMNVLRWWMKPTGGMSRPHFTGGQHKCSMPAPTIDQVRNLERKYQIKIQILFGKMYVRIRNQTPDIFKNQLVKDYIKVLT